MLLIDLFITCFILICGMLSKVYKTVRYLPASIPAMSEHINLPFLKRKHSDSSEMTPPFSYADVARRGAKTAPQTGSSGSRKSAQINSSHQGPPVREDRSYEQPRTSFDHNKSKGRGRGRGHGHQGNQNWKEGGKPGQFKQAHHNGGDRESYERSQTSQGNHSNRNQGHSQRGGPYLFGEPSSVDHRQEGQNFHQQTSATNTAQRNQGYGQRGSQFVYKDPESSVDGRQEGQAFHQQTSATNTAQRSRQNSESKDNSACNKIMPQSTTMSHSRSDSSVKSPSSESPTKSHSLPGSEETHTHGSCLRESSPPSDPVRKSMPATPMKSLSISDTTHLDFETIEIRNSPKESEKSGLSSAKRNKRSGSKDTVQGNVVPGLKDMKFESQKSETVTGVWKGVPLDLLRRAPECYSEYASLQAAGNESADYQSDRPENQPRGNKSAAVRSFVFLPHESPPEIGRNIKWILSSKLNNYWDLENAIKKIAVYNPIQSRNHGQYNPNESVDCRTLQAYFKTLTSEQMNHFFQTTLPRMQELALRLPYLFKEGLPILKQRINQEITLSQHQVACILANAFFNTFPERPRNYNAGKPLQMPDFNFINLYSQAKSERKIEKLKCIMNYFERVTQKLPEGHVTYRRVFSPQYSWQTMEEKLTNLHVSTEGTIEDERGFLQADFANKFVGGGVLNTGLVQEEIRFVLCPEMIVSRLITEMLTDEEVLVMIGCERFNAYSGYSDSFKFTGNYVDETERDEKGRMYSEVVAMDASVFRDNFYEQFKMRHVLRELNKAYCAFKRVGASNLPAVCTGNWGCGAFGGDKQLKALIQWMAASAAGRDICYLTFGDAELCLQIGHMYDILKGRNMSIKDIMQILEEYSHSTTSDTVFKYIEDTITGNVNRPEKTRSDVPKNTNVHSKSSSKHTSANRPEKSTRSDVSKQTNANTPEDNRPAESTRSDVPKQTNANTPEDNRPEESTRSDGSKQTNANTPEDNRPEESTRSDVPKQTSANTPEDNRPEESTRSDVPKQTNANTPEDNRPEESTRSDVPKPTNASGQEESTRSDVPKQTSASGQEESTRSDVPKQTNANRPEKSTRSDAPKHTTVQSKSRSRHTNK